MGLWNHSMKTAIACLALTGLVLTGCQPRPKTADSQPDSAQDKSSPVEEKVVATANGAPISLEKIRLYQYINKFNQGMGIPALPVAPPAITEKTSGVLEVARKIATIEASAAEMKKDAPTTLTQQFNQMIDQTMPQLVTKYLVLKNVDDKLDPISTEQSNKFYNEHKQEYYIPFQFRMRHLILMTYEPYTVTAGDLAAEGGLDPLESIAERVSGSKDKASLIRADLLGRPLRREQGKEFKPLIEGEKLLVPMSEEKSEEVRQKLLGILAEMKNGKKFEELARQYSEAGIGGEVSEWMPTGTVEPSPILPEIENAAKQTKVGEISQPFQTRHGWQVIEIVEKQEEGFQDIETVRSSIVQRMQEKQRKQLMNEMYSGLMTQPEVKINYELFKTTDTSKIDPDATVAEVDTGDTTKTRVRWGSFEQKWQRTHATKPEGIREALQVESDFIQKTIDTWAKKELRNSDSEFSRLVAQYRQCGLGILWMKQKAYQEAQKQITDAKVNAFYEKNKEKLRGPEMVKLMIMEKRLGGAEQKLSGVARKDALDRQIKYINEDLANCKTAADFRTAASVGRVMIEGPDPLGGQSTEIPAEQVPSPIKEQIAGLEAGKWTKPFLVNDMSAIAVLVEERTPAGYKPLEKVREQIQGAVTRELFEESLKQLEQGYLKKSGFQSQLAG